MLVIAAPGQGAQTPGLLNPWLEVPSVAERLAAWSEVAGCDLIRCGTAASMEEITDTAVAQPLIVAAGLAVAGELVPWLDAGRGREPDAAAGGECRLSRIAAAVVAAGHSVGEFTAGVVAGVLTERDALRLVAVRGRAMAAAAAAEPTGMTAVLGGDEAEVLAAIDRHGLTAANINGAGQIVAAGPRDRLAAFAASPPRGTRLRPLAVAGAFHTASMASAVAALRTAATEVRVTDPAVAVLSNADGAVIRSGGQWLDRVVAQVAAPVRWDECMRTMQRLGVTALIELPPAGTLTGLARRALPGVRTLAVKTPDDLDTARKMLAEQEAENAGDGDPTVGGRRAGVTEAAEGERGDGEGVACVGHLPEWRLLVAPLAGVIRWVSREAATTGPGVPVSVGTELGHVEARGVRRPVVPRWTGAIVEWLADDGDPVNVGQPLARLVPEGLD